MLQAMPLLSPSLGKGRRSAARPAAFPGSELVRVGIEKKQAGPLVLEDGEGHGAAGHASLDSLLLRGLSQSSESREGAVLLKLTLQHCTIW